MTLQAYTAAESSRVLYLNSQWAQLSDCRNNLRWHWTEALATHLAATNAPVVLCCSWRFTNRTLQQQTTADVSCRL